MGVCLNDTCPDVRSVAAVTIGRFGDAASAAAPKLTQLLTDENPTVRTAAVAALGQLGEHASIAVEALVVSARDQHPDVRNAASASLAQLRTCVALADRIACVQVAPEWSGADCSFSEHDGDSNWY